MTSTELAWIEAEDGYHLALADGKLRCRNAKGKDLKSVPAKVKKGRAAESLLALRDWIAAHERECAEAVERWMLRSLPIPIELLVKVADDPGWWQPLQHAVVAAIDAGGAIDPDAAGFLENVEAERGVGVVNLDGETLWLEAEQLMIPHPILLEDRNDYRELATELGFDQKIAQLYRETYDKPADLPEGSNRISAFANGMFEQLNFALGKCRTLGYRVRGGFACRSVWEGGQVVEARFWIGAEYPEAETFTGDLLWVDEREHPYELAKVGPVAFSEGMRMASAIYAARKIEEQGDEA